MGDPLTKGDLERARERLRDWQPPRTYVSIVVFDGALFNSYWPAYTLFSGEHVRGRQWGRWIDGNLHLNLSNARAIYRLGPYEAAFDRYEGTLIYSEGPARLEVPDA